MRVIVLLACSLLYWSLVGRSAGVAEPWDAAAYWRLCYPLSLVLAGGAGLVFRTRGWLAGAIVTFAQLPVMAWNGGGTLSWGMAMPFLAVLALPAMAVSAGTGWLAVRRRDRAA